MSRIMLVSLITLTLASHALAGDSPSLELFATKSGLRAENVTPGASIVLFSSTLDSRRGRLVQITDVRVLDDIDGDGVITFVPAWGVKLRSIWIAIDMRSGSHRTAGLPEYPMVVLEFPSHLLKKDSEGIQGLFENQRRSMSMVIVRPKIGAWRLSGIEGNVGDSDGVHDNKLSLASKDAKPLPGTTAAAPSRLRNGDVVAVIDTGLMQTFSTEIGK